MWADTLTSGEESWLGIKGGLTVIQKLDRNSCVQTVPKQLEEWNDWMEDGTWEM